MTFLNEFEVNTLASVGIFLGVLLAFEGIRQALSRTETKSEARNRRMRMIAAGAVPEDVLRLLKPSRYQWKLSGIPFVGTLPVALRQAGLTIGPTMFLMMCLCATLTVGGLASVVVWPPIAVGGAVLIFFCLPILIVRSMQERRMTAMIRQLPDALDLMSRGLIVGHPLNTTIASVARDMSDPIGTEFGVIVDQISYGDDLVDAFADFAERTDLEDVHYLSVSVAIQAGTGGNLAQVLGTLAKVIRDRISMRKRIQAISSEGRLTSYFLSFLPLVILALMSVTTPEYYGGVSSDPLFRPIAAVVVTLMVVNFIAMRRLVNFRI
ncbi:MAG: type II secretion system F family protein [Paracoccaceae bacterium]|nr:type II secretion system F family protein [Paracoccaceae bacterium]MDH5529777.1 type II secretion system F family protein [Paracoccaceae bacterium]